MLEKTAIYCLLLVSVKQFSFQWSVEKMCAASPGSCRSVHLLKSFNATLSRWSTLSFTDSSVIRRRRYQCGFVTYLSGNSVTSTKLSRNDQEIIFWQRMEHCRLRHLVYQKLKICTADLCVCSKEKQTPHHNLQSCQLHNSLRQRTWPDPFTPTAEALQWCWKPEMNCHVCERDELSCLLERWAVMFVIEMSCHVCERDWCQCLSGWTTKKKEMERQLSQKWVGMTSQREDENQSHQEQSSSCLSGCCVTAATSKYLI